MGRKKKYIKKSFEKGINEYFDSISVRRAMTENVPTGEYTNKGKPIFRERELVNMRGETVYKTDYIEPPSVSGLCLYLGISYKTWENYRKTEGYADICDGALLKMQAYLERELVTRDRPQGVIFNLQNNFGWKEEKSVTVGGVEDYLASIGGEQSL